MVYSVIIIIIIIIANKMLIFYVSKMNTFFLSSRILCVSGVLKFIVVPVYFWPSIVAQG